MSTIQDTFTQAILAEAAYANLIDPQTGLPYSSTTAIKTALQDAQNNMFFSDAQVADFLNTWDIVQQQPDTISGFSATLLKNRKTGAYSYAIRGTAGGTDIAADVGDIVLDGLAMDQIVDMYNHWMKLLTPLLFTICLRRLRRGLIPIRTVWRAIREV